MRIFLGDDFNDVAVLQARVQGHHPAIHQGPRAMVAHLRMNPVGKIHRGCMVAEGNHIALGCKDINLILKEIFLNIFQILMRILQIALPFQQLPQPNKLFIVGASG